MKAFDPATTQLSEVASIQVNTFDDPATAWQAWQALSAAKKDDRWLSKNVAWAAARLGRHKEAIDLLESLPGFTESFPGPLFEANFPLYITAPVLAWARQQSGDEAGARRLTAIIESYIQALKEQGATWTLPLLEAEVYALKGEHDAVVAALEQAHRDGYLSWIDLNFPFFDAVREREDFQAIVRSVDAQVNAERAKLGWEPVD